MTPEVFDRGFMAWNSLEWGWEFGFVPGPFSHRKNKIEKFWVLIGQTTGLDDQALENDMNLPLQLCLFHVYIKDQNCQWLSKVVLSAKNQNKKIIFTFFMCELQFSLDCFGSTQ